MGVSNITRTVDAVQSGTWNVNAIASTGFPVLATDGSAAGTAGIHVLGTDGTNAQIFSTNATGHVNIADGGNSITVDGTVAVSGTVTVDSEMSVAAALTDNFANPTAGGVGAFGMVWDGSTWDRQAGNAVGGAYAQGGIAHDVAISGMNPLLIGAYGKATAPTAASADGDMVNLWCDLNGRLQIGDGGGSITVDGTVAVSGSVDTELPTAAALADNTANPTVPAVGGFNMVYDGSTWDRMPGNSAGGTFVQGPAAHDAALVGNPLVLGGYAKTTVPTSVTADGDVVNAWFDRGGRMAVWDGDLTISIDDGGGSITVDGTFAATGNIAHDGVWSGNPVLIAGYASATAPTAVSADGDVVRPWYDLNGRQVIGDGGGSISIDDNGGAITVDGTVAISGSVAVTGTFGIATAGSAHITTGPQMMVSDGTNAVRLKGTSTGSAYVTGEAIAALTTQASISVTTTRTALIASNANRKGFIVVNQGTAAIYVGNGAVVDGSTAVSNGGTYVSGYGGSIDGTQMCGYTGAISAVAASGTQIITVMEW